MARAGGRRLPGRCRRGGAARSLITWSGRTRVATSASLPEAWFFAVLILAGLSVGSLGLSLLGLLLGRDWVTPMEDELRPAALLIPPDAVPALPLAFGGFHSWRPEAPRLGQDSFWTCSTRRSPHPQ